MHGSLVNQFLRNSFRTAFNIDAVLFPPDQTHFAYTKRDDVWMAISDWTPSGRLVRRGNSDRVKDTWAAVIVEDEFEDSFGGIGRKRLLGPLLPPVPLAHLSTLISETWRDRATQLQLRIGA